MWRKLLVLCVFLLACGAAAGASIAPATPAMHPAETRRLALVIGNGNYQDDPLRNPVSDADAMSRTLRSLGFDVMRYQDLTRQRMTQVLDEFGHRLDAGGVGLFYFAGHGFRSAGKTMLVPVDTDKRSPADLAIKGIDLRAVLDSMSRPRPGKLNLVILDTCLNNPFRTGDPGVNAAPGQTLIAYATAPGSLAVEGARHGLYTSALLKTIAVPGQDLDRVFQQVNAAVRQASGQRQVPWVSSSLSSQFRFVTGPPRSRVLPNAPSSAHDLVLAAQSRGILPKDSAEQYELTFWESIKDSTHISDYEAYLQTYPNGRFAALARARIARLRAAAPKTEAPAETPHPAPAVKTPRKPPPSAPVVAPTEKPSGTATAGTVKDCINCPELVALSAGTFTMGNNASDPSEKPAHRVSIRKPFAIGKYEVTVTQWNACADAGGCPRIPNGANRAENTPVRDVSWDDAQQYVKWLSKLTGKSYRLPTEAEWEYAARGGTSTKYWWGEQMRKGNANCKDCGEPWQQERPADAGSFAANPYGLYDMSGSVWEWVSDCWHNDYKGAPANGSSWDAPNCRVRVIRGGSWRDGATYMLSSTRFKYDASVRYSQNGFRVARDAE